MASVSAKVFAHHKKKDGSYNVKIQRSVEKKINYNKNFIRKIRPIEWQDLFEMLTGSYGQEVYPDSNNDMIKRKKDDCSII